MVEPLNALLTELAPDLCYENVVYPNLLEQVTREGISPQIREKVRKIIEEVPQDPPRIILCSCSTLGGCAEEMQLLTRNRVIRIDRPMTELAVTLGRRIGVAAALESTMGPTKNLLREVAREAGRQIEISDFLCFTAWDRKQNGDAIGYVDEIVTALGRAKGLVDVIVLAQGSMAPAAGRLTHLGIPILSSPRPAIETVVRMTKRAV